MTDSISTTRVSASALRGFLPKISPFFLLRNPVMLMIEGAAAFVSLVLLRDLWISGRARSFDLEIAVWLWITVLIAAFVEALAEARARARADLMRKSRSEVLARRLDGRRQQWVAPSRLHAGDIVLVGPGEVIPVDGEIVEGIAVVDESVITGESAPVIRESGSETSLVTAGTRVVSDSLRVRVKAPSTPTFLDRMLLAVETNGPEQTRAEHGMQAMVAGMAVIAAVVATVVFVVVRYGDLSAGLHGDPPLAAFAGLVVCLLPATFSALFPVNAISSMERAVAHNTLPLSRAVLERAARVDVVLFDKTGTITVGNREAKAFVPFSPASESELAAAAGLASMCDDTLEGQSIVKLASKVLGRDPAIASESVRAVAFSSFTRMSGVDLGTRRLRKGATSAIADYVRGIGGSIPDGFVEESDAIARAGGTPLAVADDGRILGLIRLKDSRKTGVAERLNRLREMGIASVLITGDNPVTAAALARDSNIDSFIAQATPADKLAHVKREQSSGCVIAVVGDGANDAPALAQADVGMAMYNGAPAARDAANAVDLDSDPAKIVEFAVCGRQMVATRMALAAFAITASIAQLLTVGLRLAVHTDLSRWAILPLRTGESAVLSGVICNALSIVFLLPAALHGVHHQWVARRPLIRREIAVYSLAGFVLTPPAIWAIDRMIAWIALI